MKSNQTLFRRIAALLIAFLLFVPAVLPVTALGRDPVVSSPSSGGALISESEVYQYVLSELLKCKEEINVERFQLSENELKTVFSSIYYAEAELFYMDGRYTYTKLSGSGVIKTINPVYVGESSSIPAQLEEFHTLTAEIINGIDPSLGEWEKVAYIHDYVALHFDYDHDYQVYDAYQFLKTGVGVCQAYSLLTRYLLVQLGIGCECVACDELTHEWNVVSVGGQWYHMDVTWDDRDDKGFYGQVSHEYFLASDDYFDVGEHHAAHGWDSPVAATSKLYDGRFKDVTSPFIFTGGTIYAINDGSISTYDPATNTFEALLELNLSWHTYGNPMQVWNGTYSALVLLNGKLYFNGENAIYSYDPAENKKAQVDVYLDLSGTVFGMRAEGSDRAIVFTLSLMADPNGGKEAVTEVTRSKGGYVITWVVGTESYETLCLPNEEPHFDGSLSLASNVFDYEFLDWDKTPRKPTKDATYTAQFRMTRNDVTLEGKTLREQYRLLHAAKTYLSCSDEGYAEASAMTAELNSMISTYNDRITEVNGIFTGVLFGD